LYNAALLKENTGHSKSGIERTFFNRGFSRLEDFRCPIPPSETDETMDQFDRLLGRLSSFLFREVKEEKRHWTFVYFRGKTDDEPSSDELISTEMRPLV
jgi:hypothetical protein